ncbi:MAG: hypothetical protein K9M99_08445 [Candidatus Cloacimonetes bacterium]|nr:hypothetical protein [Candidatus Cloacimonadota bacterium]
MRPIARKLYSKIDDKGMSKDQVREFFDRMSPAERKQSFPDDCLFQSEKYFAETVMKELLQSRLVKIEDNKYFKNEKKKEEDKRE